MIKMANRNSSPGYAHPSDVEKAAQNWTDDQIECRATNQHYWNRKMTFLVRQTRGSLTVRQFCGRGCGAFRDAVMNESTGILTRNWSTKYDKDENGIAPYLLPKGTGRIDAMGRARLRLALFSNLAVTEALDDA